MDFLRTVFGIILSKDKPELSAYERGYIAKAVSDTTEMTTQETIDFYEGMRDATRDRHHANRNDVDD